MVIVRVAREKRSWAEDRSEMDKVRGVGMTDRAVFVQGKHRSIVVMRDVCFSGFHRFRVKFPSQKEKVHYRYNGGTNNINYIYYRPYVTRIFYDSLVFHLKLSFEAESFKKNCI